MAQDGEGAPPASRFGNGPVLSAAERSAPSGAVGPRPVGKLGTATPPLRIAPAAEDPLPAQEAAGAFAAEGHPAAMPDALPEDLTAATEPRADAVTAEADLPPEPAAQVLTGSGAPDLYLEHFGLRERPFSLLPDPGFLFWSQVHARAYAILEYGVLTRAPITLITGDVGAGKTTLLHHLLRNLGPAVTVGMVSNAHGSRGELLRWVLMALNRPAPPDADYVELFSAFQRHAIAEYAAGRRVILIFDEAQNLGRETLEELRMFTNINANKDDLLQIILVGQPELRAIVRQPDMAQFAQRVAASFHLPALEAEAVGQFIDHRLAVAGASAPLFSPEAVAMIHTVTGGVPRLVNQLCDLALVYAYTRDQADVSADTVQSVLDDGVFFGAVRSAEVAAPPAADATPKAEATTAARAGRAEQARRRDGASGEAP